MTTSCLVCLRPSTETYHERCLRRLFHTVQMPRVDLDLAHFQTVALGMVGRATVSGVQRKISLGLRVKRQTLQLDTSGNRFILKPPAETFPSLPENEHLSMQLAALFGLAVPPNGLVRMADENLAYVVARFDRPYQGGKLRQEDFCQLSRKSPKDKYHGSAELCARVVRDYSAEPIIDSLRLFEMFVFAWWIGNGDAHLKNFSLLADREGRHALSPVYDQVNTWILGLDRDLALPLGGKAKGLTRRTWMEFGRYCGLPDAAIERVLETPGRVIDQARVLVAASPLASDLQNAYLAVLEEQAASVR